MLLIPLILALGLTEPTGAGGGPAAPLKVVTSLPTYAAIARELAGDKATVTAIAQGDEDPHFVQPKPSFVALLRNADMFITTGMDLELWVPALLDRAGNRRIVEGGPGYVSASRGLALLEVPASVSRAAGDIHVDGNPHIHTDPLNGILIARNILAGLRRIAPADAAYFTAREQDFEKRVLEATMGAELVGILTPQAAFDLLQKDQLLDFIKKQQYQGKPLPTASAGGSRRAKCSGGRRWSATTRSGPTSATGTGCPAWSTSRPSRAFRRRRGTCRK